MYNNEYRDDHEMNMNMGQPFNPQPQFQPQPPKDPGKGRRRKNFAKKAAGITALALLFGTVSGGVMAGVNVLSDSALRSHSTVVAQASALKAAPPATALQTSSVMDVSSIVAASMPSIVAINDKMTVQEQTFFGPQSLEAESSGSGIIVGKNNKELLIATNNHVIDGGTNIKVTFADQKSANAAIKGTDAASDLAIIAVPLDKIPADTMSKIQIAKLGDSDNLKVGQQVVAIGNALGEGQSATVGYVSALNRKVETDDGITKTYIQTDAAINPGNSGGALLDVHGNVIGINAAKTAETDVEGMGYAIPISTAKKVLNTLMTQKTRVPVAQAKQGWLGIEGTSVDSQSAQTYGMPEGVYVFKIMDNSGAAKSDLREKDIITGVEGQSILNMEQLKDIISSYESGSKVDLTVKSLVNGKYQAHKVTVTLGERPATES